MNRIRVFLCAAAVFALCATAWAGDGDVIRLKRQNSLAVDNGTIADDGSGYKTAIYYFGDVPTAFKVGFGLEVENSGRTATNPIAYQLDGGIVTPTNVTPNTNDPAEADVALSLTDLAIENGPITVGVAGASTSPTGFMGSTKALAIVPTEVTFAPIAPVVQIEPSAKDIDAPVFINFNANYIGPAGSPIKEALIPNGLRVYLLDADGRPTVEIPGNASPVRIIGSEDANAVFATFHDPFGDLFITGGTVSAGAAGGTARLALVKGTGSDISLHSKVSVLGTTGHSAPDASDILATVEIRVCDHMVTPSSVTLRLPQDLYDEPEFAVDMRTADLDSVRDGQTCLVASNDLSSLPGGSRYASRGGVEVLGGEDEVTVKIGTSFIHEKAGALIEKAGDAAIDETITLKVVDKDGKFGDIILRFTKDAGIVTLPAAVETTNPDAPIGVTVDERIDLSIKTNRGTSADLVPDRGFSDGDFASDGDHTRLTPGSLAGLAEAAGLPDGIRLTSLPIVSQDVKAEGRFAIFTFLVPGGDLVLGDPIPASDADVYKVTSANSCTNISSGFVSSYAELLERPIDGRYTFIGLDDIRPVDTIASDAIYRLVIAIQDGGRFDLNSGEHIVADPLVVARSTQKGEHSGSGGCAAGAGLVAAAALAVKALRKRKK